MNGPENVSFCGVSHRNPLATRNLNGGNTENSSDQSKCHPLIESATDETSAKAMLPPRRAVSDYELE
jgi:hypothetical protein